MSQVLASGKGLYKSFEYSLKCMRRVFIIQNVREAKVEGLFFTSSQVIDSRA